MAIRGRQDARIIGEPCPTLRMTARTDTPPLAYRRNDLATFNLLVNRPIWVFDVERKSMWWANDAAVALWSAPNLESLLARDFRKDMSESSCQRLHELMITFHRGERTTDQVSPTGSVAPFNREL